MREINYIEGISRFANAQQILTVFLYIDHNNNIHTKIFIVFIK